MKTLRLTVLALALASPLVLALAARARADVYVLDVVSNKRGVSLHDASVYNGLMGLIAHRHGGVLVSSFHETNAVGETGDRLVVLWRFPSAKHVEAVRRDPNYFYVEKLRAERFDDTGVAPLQVAADR
jgi:uncharacterized protein (DUF1330 family)